MPTGRLSTLVRRLHDLAELPHAAEVSDAQLLERFTTAQEEAAFAALVRRHGPLVLGVCRRVLHNPHDAEDAFQATFLILVRKAASIKQGAALGCWLHEVALRTAVRLRAREAGRRQREQRVPDMPQKDCLAAVVWRDLQPVLDEEVQRLPPECREAFVVCYLEGKTYEEAARQLGCRPGTISRRLTEARRLLRTRLTRRGVVLPVGLLAMALTEHTAPAAVPAPLVTATVKAALASAAGAAAIPARVAALVEGGIRGLAAGKGKVALALLLAAGLLWAGAAVFSRAAQAGKARESAPAEPRPAAPSQPTDKLPADVDFSIKGRVVDAGSKPVADAALAVYVLAMPAGRASPGMIPPELLAEGKSDADGQFRLTARRLSAARTAGLRLFARRPGHGLGVAQLKSEPVPPEVEVQLPPEETILGRLVDLQGQPAAGVKLDVIGARQKAGPGRYYWPVLREPLQSAAYWPPATITDASGRFTLRGLGADWGVTLQASDERFARQHLAIPATDGVGRKEVTLALAPARVLEGVVTYEDTGKPAPHARLRVHSQQDRSLRGISPALESKADAQGRFKVVPYPGNVFSLTASPGPDEPYLLRTREVDWPRGGAVKQDVKISLARGIRVQGVVTEGTDRKPVAGASVRFRPRITDNPFYRRDLQPFFDDGDRRPITGPDGKFAMTVLPGPGHLQVNGPTADYVHTEVTTPVLLGKGVGPNRRHYSDGLVALELKPDVRTHEVSVALRRGVTVSGGVVAPDGKAVKSGQFFCASYLPYGDTLNPVRTLPIKDGRFELPGCDRDRAVKVFFYDGDHGGVAELSGKDGADPKFTVRLQPCGSATARLVDGESKPLADVALLLEIPITSGASFFDRATLERYELVADAAMTSNLDHERFGKLKTDAEGRVTFPALIPGAQYRIIARQLEGPGMFLLPREFTARAGETIALGDINVKFRR
jgi:RNA polymerase sigma factor (sigma-70 family)